MDISIPMPQIVEAALMPFRDVIIHDGIVALYGVCLSRNISEQSKQIYLTEAAFFPEEQETWIRTIFRETYVAGEGKADRKGYEITGRCIGCGKCQRVCPQRAIEKGDTKMYRIMQEHCLHCGSCYENCPQRAIVSRQSEEGGLL